MGHFGGGIGSSPYSCVWVGPVSLNKLLILKAGSITVPLFFLAASVQEAVPTSILPQLFAVLEKMSDSSPDEPDIPEVVDDSVRLRKQREEALESSAKRARSMLEPHGCPKGADPPHPSSASRTTGGEQVATTEAPERDYVPGGSANM